LSAQLAVLESVALLRSGAHAMLVRDQFQLDQLSDYQQRQFKFIWEVARESGGGLTRALERLAQVFYRQSREHAEQKLAFASPRATANLILLLPLVALLGAELMGLRATSAALSSGAGVLALGLGIILLIAARVSSLRMLLRAKPFEYDPGIFFDAMVIALSSGLGAKSALTLVRSSYLEHFGEVPDESMNQLNQAIKFSEQSGIALSGILTARADSLRHLEHDRSRSVLARLAISLLIPLGLAALPAFLLLAVVPLALGFLSKN
jgi:tight adherence protein B